MIERCRKARQLLAAIGTVVVIPVVYFETIFSDVVKIRLGFERRDCGSGRLLSATSLTNFNFLGKQHTIESSTAIWIAFLTNGADLDQSSECSLD